MLDYFALGLLVFVGLVLFYGIIVVHDIPYEIAHKRNHPHQDAIHVAGWVSLFTLHVLWPFLWIWATIYREDRGWGFQHQAEERLALLENQIAGLQATIDSADHNEKNAPASADNNSQAEGAND
ncbi:Inner membrane protein YiaW [BD1-7 clade bacterium]|uniref:Inner membrane protein YiaW n=1 Tax=BD1-7 clade bacterium TaxID=2029982 RepID=A0A5S9MTN6_9GAMM|nr:Inner membrane protein YiaW [BD1-7 clade bacterium]CAA0085087.1 Inner membrane protein YiaW [BD1-7 clade bacterium]